MLGFLTGWYPGARVSPPGLGPVPSRAAGAVQVPAAAGGAPSGGPPHAPAGASLVDQVMPWGPRRQWGVSGPLPLRSWLASAQDLTATVQTIIRTTRGQDDVTQAVASGHARAPGHPGSVTFLPRFGRALTLQVPYPLLCLA